MMHASSDGIIWKPAAFKGQDVWVRVAAEDDISPYVSESSGKCCVKYKNTPKANWYWSTPDLVEIKAPQADEEQGDGGRRSKRRRGEDGRAEIEREEAERKKLPQPADNGKLYGVMPGSASRKQFVRGKDMKTECAKCGAVLDGQEVIGFVEAERSKTVKRRYGDDPRSSSDWSKSVSYSDRAFTCLVPCWEIPKCAQKSLRGLIDIHGYAELPDASKGLVRDKLGWEEDPAPAEA